MNRLSRIIAVLWAASAIGCMTSKNVSLVENRNPASRPEQIEITSRGGVYTVHWPVVDGDSLRGWRDRTRTNSSSFALSDIQRARIKELNAQRTAVAVSLGIVATVFVLILSAGDIAPSY